MELLIVKNLTCAFGGVIALDDVDFTVKKGEIFGLIGPNGAGKTTCFNVITGFYKATNGSVRWHEREILGSTMNALAMGGLVRTYQHTSLFPTQTVFENIMIGAHKHAYKSLLSHLLYTKKLRNSEKQLSDRANEVLKFMDMNADRDVIAANLPYVSQRRLEIAIALVAGPELLLLDEPAAGMNPSEAEQLMTLIKEIRNQDITVMLVEHNMRLVMGICDRLVVLDHGLKIAEGIPQEIRNNKQVIDVYLGKADE